MKKASPGNWGLLGCQSAKSLLNTVNYYNGKLFGLRGGEHRNTVANFELGNNFIRFEENVAKTFHGGLTDLNMSRGWLSMFVIL